ncbi:hypothetical protein HYH03_002475 [Edaphochlamys debaryana]|uniref:ABC transporter domain-containing protein n=1 Tax=Edaphochlamys debaryana TaxID=47281 RepID=A0A835YD55_9CHLO|nr:hypothetical protein HYH03_002475 [Edaphochlamys debaryana]|eukprot:KAG2499529.1 hypothetical protein HYH03_002475 [Edaphochlamys debaryana]
MGPSGAGKSTLLDELACNNNNRGASSEGSVLVDGQPRSARSFRALSCYVQQTDALLSSGTVREVLLTSALLRLPYSIPLSQKREVVEETIRELDLVSCADTMIGDESVGLKGISGGQKRRVSVGVELVKDPRVLFLDEPSSGLDSEAALGVMSALSRLARRGRTVVATIHQPNSMILDTFDDFILLAGGRTAYGGSWSDAIPFFDRAGFECPAYKCPTDYFMTVVVREEAAAVDALVAAYDKERPALLQQQREAVGRPGGASAGSGRLTLDIEAGAGAGAGAPGVQARGGAEAGSEARPGGDAAARVAPFEAEGAAGTAGAAKAAGAPLWYQIAVLSLRYWRSWIRNPVLMASELVQYIFLGIFLGAMYCRFNNVMGEGDFDRSSCIFFSLAILCFTPSYTAITNWGAERVLLKREVDQGLYPLFAYYVARYSVIVPFELLQCLLFLAIMYFFAGFYPAAVNFFTFMAVFGMFQVISEGIGACCAVACKSITGGIVLATLVLLLLFAFSGFLIVKTPVYFVWLQKTTYFTYAYTSLVELELSSITLTDPATGQTVPGMQAFPQQIKTSLSYAENIWILFAQFGGMELIKIALFYVTYWTGMM